MSLKAYIDAIVTTLTTELTLDAAQIGSRLMGQPPANCPTFYYAIHPTQWTSTNPQSNEAQHEQYSISITLTQRVSHIPNDRLSSDGYYATNALHDRVRAVMATMLKENRTILTAANATISGTDKIQTPLVWLSTEIPPRIVGPEWFFADPNSNRPTLGLVSEIQFGQAERHQTQDNVE
jgi:hypothetical protein